MTSPAASPGVEAGHSYRGLPTCDPIDWSEDLLDHIWTFTASSNERLLRESQRVIEGYRPKPYSTSEAIPGILLLS